jgi:hypothetical protein
MEKISKRSVKMFNGRLVFGEEPVHLTTHLIVTSLERQLRKQIRPPHPAIPLAWKRKSSGLHIIRVLFGDESWKRGQGKNRRS